MQKQTRVKKPRPFAVVVKAGGIEKGLYIYNVVAAADPRIVLASITGELDAGIRCVFVNAAFDVAHAERCAVCPHKREHDQGVAFKKWLGITKEKLFAGEHKKPGMNIEKMQKQILASLTPMERALIEKRHGIKPLKSGEEVSGLGDLDEDKPKRGAKPKAKARRIRRGR